MFKVFIKNLRNGVESANSSGHLKLVTVQDLARFDFDIYSHFKADLKSMGNNTPKKGPELQLLGLGGLDIRDVDNEGKKDIENNDTDTASRIRQAVDYEADEDSYFEALDARPKKTRQYLGSCKIFKLESKFFELKM